MIKRIAPAVLTAVAFVAVMSTASPVKGQTTYLWSGSGLNTNWSTVENWSLSVPPPSNVNDTILRFSNLGVGGWTISTMSSNFAARGLEFTLGTAPTNFNITNGGAFTLSLGQNGISNTSGSHTIGVNIALNTAQSWINDSTGLSITGTVANGGNLLTVSGTGNTSITGAISGTGGLTKTGAGILTLGAVNNYSGATTVSAGTLRAGVAGAFVDAAYSLGTGTTLDLNNFDQTIASLDGSGAVTLGSGTLTVGSGTFSGAISGTGGLTKTGAGTLTLSSANSYSGFTRVGGGTLSISQDLNLGAVPGAVTPTSLSIDGGTLSATASFSIATNRGIVVGPNAGSGFGTIDVASGQTVTYGGVIASPSGTGGLIKAGAGTLTLSGVNTYTGATQIDNGVLSISAAGNIPAGSAPININGGTLRVTSTVSSSGTIVNPTHPIVIGSAGGATTGTIDVTNATTIIIYAPGTTSTLITSANGAGTGTIVKTGPGTFRVTNAAVPATANMNVQKLVVTGGLWQGGLDTAFGFAPLSPLVDAITLDGGGISSNAGFNLIANRGITIGAGGGTVNTASALNILGRITGTGGLTKAGSGSVAANTLTLSNANNDYTGGTIITSGTLLLSSTNRLPLTGDVSFTGASTVLSLGTTTVVASQSINALNSAGGLGTINTGTNAGTATLTLGNGNGSGNYSGTITNNANNLGIVAVTKTGNGTQTFSGANTYSGATNINGGTLLVNNTTGSGTGTGAVNVNANGTLGGTGTISGAVTVAGTGTLAPGTSPGTLTVNNAVTLNSGSNFNVEFVGGSNTSDRLVSNSLAVSGATLNISIFSGTLMATDQFTIAQSTSNITGTFAGLPNTGLGGNVIGGFDLPLYLYYNAKVDVDGQTIVPSQGTLTLTPVPEPTTILALGTLTFGALSGIRKLRRRETASPVLAA